MRHRVEGTNRAHRVPRRRQALRKKNSTRDPFPGVPRCNLPQSQRKGSRLLRTAGTLQGRTPLDSDHLQQGPVRHCRRSLARLDRRNSPIGNNLPTRDFLPERKNSVAARRGLAKVGLIFSRSSAMVGCAAQKPDEFSLSRTARTSVEGAMNTRPAGAEQLALAQNKDLYEIGEIPPLGHVPASMYAWAVRKDRHGPPEKSMQVEVVPTWTLDSHDVLVLVMAAGVNYNGVWAALGEPVLRTRRTQKRLSHRRLRRIRNRLGGRLESAAMESRRRGGRSLQPGRRRR